MEKCSLMVVDDSGTTLKLAAHKGLPPDVVAKASVPMGEGISGFVAKCGKPMLIGNIESNPYWARRNRETYLTKSCLCVPMKSGDKVLGVLNAADRRSG